MSVTYTVKVSIEVMDTSTNERYGSGRHSCVLDAAGGDTTYASGKMTAGSSAEAIPLGEIGSSPGYIMFHNLGIDPFYVTKTDGTTKIAFVPANAIILLYLTAAVEGAPKVIRGGADATFQYWAFEI